MTDGDFEELSTEGIDWEQLGTENRELLRDWSQRKEQELLDMATQCQHASSVCPVGRDRSFRYYWVFQSIPGLFVEESATPDNSTTSELTRQLDGPLNSNEPQNNSSEVESAQPHTRWSVYGSVEDVDQLLESLNARGLREGPLRIALLEQKDRLKEWVSKCDVAMLSTPCSVCEKTNLSAAEGNDNLVEVVRDMILDFEDRVYSGSLGSLKV